MDADTVIRYKNDSREWIFKDNDLCKTKETSKSFKDADPSEFESNVEIFGEITIQFNNEIHLLYDGPVQIKCSRRSQDYSFNCSNVINKSNEGIVSKAPEISRRPNATLNKRGSTKDVCPKTIVEKYISTTQPTIPINSRSKIIKSSPGKVNKNVTKSDTLYTKTKLTASDDVCSRTSQVIIPRRINSNQSDLANKASTACVPISSLHSTTATVHQNVAAKESSITKNIRATFNKLIQSNASSLQTTLDDIRIINTNLKSVSPVKDNAKENLTILVAGGENTNASLKKDQIEVNNRKSKLHEKILRGRSKAIVPDKDISIISEVINNQIFGKELPNDCISTPVKKNVTIQDDVILIEDSKIPNLEEESLAKKTEETASNINENILQNYNEISLTTVTSKEKLGIPGKRSTNNITGHETIKIISKEKNEVQISSETSLTNSSKIEKKFDKISKLNKGTTENIIGNKPKVKLQESSISLNDHLQVHENSKIQELNEVIFIDTSEKNTSSLDCSNFRIPETKKRKSENIIDVADDVDSIKNSTEKIYEQNSTIEINNDKKKISIETFVISKNENANISTENTILENTSKNQNNNEKIIKNVVEVVDLEKNTEIANARPEKTNESSQKVLKGKKRTRSNLKTSLGSPTSSTGGNKSGIQKKLTQYFTKKSNQADELLNIAKDEIETENVDGKTESSKVGICNIENLVSNTITESESGSSNAEKLQHLIIGNNECLRNISISVLEGNQNAEQNKTSDIENNKIASLSKTVPEETIATLAEENSEVIQKENIPATTNEATVVAKSKDLTKNEEASTNVRKTKLKERLRSKLKATARRMTRSKRPSKLGSIKKSSNRKTSAGSNTNNSLKIKNVVDDSKNETVVENISETENIKSPSVNKTTSIKRESKPDETENIIRLDTIGTEIHTFHCKKCDKIFLRKSLLIKHEKESHPLKKIEKATKRVRKIRQKYDCSKCSESFPNVSALKLHECSKHVSNVDVSDKVQDDTAKEQESNIEEPATKRICTEESPELKIEEIVEIKTETELPTENTKPKKKIDKSLNKSFICPHCNVNMLSTNDLKVHVKRVHEKVKSKICPYCSRGFTCTGDLTRHIRLHTGEKPFKCTQKGCKMAFIASGDLIKHERTHLGDQYPRNFACDICGKSFKQRYEHDRHMRTAHTSAIKQFECHLCNKQFGRKDGLMYHLRLHAGIKPYTCKTCGKQFTDSGNLKKHMNTRRHELPPKKKRNRQKKTVETDKQ